MALYRLFVPKAAAGSNKVYWDLFNAAGSGMELDVLACVPIVSGAVAVTGSLSVDLFLTRTSAVGTGGTAATVNGVALDAATITSHDNSMPFDRSFVTVRSAPTGGATAGAVISFRSVFTEETSVASYWPCSDMVRPRADGIPSLLVPQSTGLRVVQGAIASVGNIAFEMLFNVRRL